MNTENESSYIDIDISLGNWYLVKNVCCLNIFSFSLFFFREAADLKSAVFQLSEYAIRDYCFI